MNRNVEGAIIGSVEVTVEAVKVRDYYQALELDPPGPLEPGEVAPVAFPVDNLNAVWGVLDISHDRSLHAGHAISAQRAPRIGERLTGVTRVTRIWDKAALTFATLSTRYTDTRGDEVLVSEMTIVERQEGQE